MNRLYAGLSPEEGKAKLSEEGKLSAGVEECLWQTAGMDRITGNRPNKPGPSIEVLVAAEQALNNFLERFDLPGLARVNRLVRDALGVIGNMQAEATGRH